MKKSELRRDPDKVAQWQRSSRQPLNPGRRKKRVSIPPGMRTKVRARSGGWCVACLARNGIFGQSGNLERRQRMPVRLLAARGEIEPVAHLHHVLPVNLFPEWELTRNNLVGVCPGCHDEHERAHRRIPFEALPLEVRLFAQNAGGQEALYISRTYPSRRST